MGATSLKLPDDLKKRIQSLVAGTGRTAHAFMLEAIARETERAELRRKFGAEAAEAEEQTLRSGRAYDAHEVFTYLKAKASGQKARRPRAKPWRRSS
jgi:predicted transcriptional regulator